MFAFTCLVLFVVSVTSMGIKSSKDNGELYDELPCISFGGACVRSDNCAEDYAAISELCPMQKSATCCYSVPRKETRCRQRGGSCVSKSTECGERTTYKQASDCGENKKCCIYV